MGSGVLIYVPSFIKIGSGVQKLIGGGYTHTHGQQRDLISLLYFFKIRKVGYLSTTPWRRMGKWMYRSKYY
jgi:hypothetical protein